MYINELKLCKTYANYILINVHSLKRNAIIVRYINHKQRLNRQCSDQFFI